MHEQSPSHLTTKGASTTPHGVDEIRPAVVTINLYRGHLDPEVATLPLPTDVASRAVGANVRYLDAARSLKIPVGHVVTSYDDTSDCVDTCDGSSFRDSALTIIERAFGWVMNVDEALAVVSSKHSLL
jgi:hypothetical protein